MNKRDWYKRRNIKNLKNRTKKKLAKKAQRTRVHKRNYIQKQLSIQQNEKKLIEENGNYKIPFKIPKIFSLIDNPNETIDFFNNILQYIRNKYNKGNRLFFDMSDVEYVSNDALMYLIAIIKNTKIKFNSSGNLPKNKNCRNLVIESGFLDYLNTLKELELTTTTNKLRIRIGNNINREVAKTICDFFIDSCGIPRIKCKFMYDIIIELMTNTIQHAYNNSMLISYWYVFLERNDNIVKMVFLDTGDGIPETLRKNWLEKIKLLNVKDDCELIQSALNGDFRTRTEQKYRGKGLPKIYKYYKEGKIKNLKIISRHGVISSNNNNLKSKLQGTLFSWEIDINKFIEEE